MTTPNPPRLIGVKIFVFLTLIISVVSLAASGYLYQMLNVERRERVALTSAKTELEDQISTLQQESSQFKGSAVKMQEQLKTFAAEKDQWKKQLDEAEAENNALQAKIKSFEGPSALVPTSEASAIPGASQPTAPAAPAGGQAPKAEPIPAATGFQVMTVNRKFNFVVINVGLQDQIKMGDKFGIERNQKQIATIQVEKVYDRFAAAAILQESKESPIKEGDLVRKT